MLRIDECKSVGKAIIQSKYSFNLSSLWKMVPCPPNLRTSSCGTVYQSSHDFILRCLAKFSKNLRWLCNFCQKPGGLREGIIMLADMGNWTEQEWEIDYHKILRLHVNTSMVHYFRDAQFAFLHHHCHSDQKVLEELALVGVVLEEFLLLDK